MRIVAIDAMATQHYGKHFEHPVIHPKHPIIV
jgi:hypothetical protein